MPSDDQYQKWKEVGMYSIIGKTGGEAPRKKYNWTSGSESARLAGKRGGAKKQWLKLIESSKINKRDDPFEDWFNKNYPKG